MSRGVETTKKHVGRYFMLLQYDSIYVSYCHDITAITSSFCVYDVFISRPFECTTTALLCFPFLVYDSAIHLRKDEKVLEAE
jgi:hypothetical protein